MKVRRPKNKYLRFIWLALQLGLFSATCGFVAEYLWDHGLSFAGFRRDLIIARAVDALTKGLLFGGVYIAFPMWLALENFRKRKQ